MVIGETYNQCRQAWDELIKLLTDLGFAIDGKKVVAPTTNLTFLGIHMDTEACQLLLPQEKLIEIRSGLDHFVGQNRANTKQSIAGKLNFAAKVVRGGRTFLRRILDCINKLKRPYHKVRIEGSIRKDLVWWQSFMGQFNGMSRFIDDRPITPIHSDACQTSGGAFCEGDFL